MNSSNRAATSHDATRFDNATGSSNATGYYDATSSNYDADCNDATGPNNGTSSNDARNNATNSNDVQIKYLETLFHELLVGIVSVAKLDQPGQPETLRKKLFGLTKGLSRDIGPNNPLDYEQKYPQDQPGEVLAENARVWLTYLDEAGAYDRDKVEGWKDTVDVLLVFAGLFSGVITTFVSQASQSLQQDNTQVSASLMFEMVQLQRAQFSGSPISDVPMSPLTPTSTFNPTTSAFLVNGLWFTSLAISLATALVAVLTKQWLYYYMSAISGTAVEKVRLRHFRFRGLEAWKVGLIIDLLPVFLHLALGVFLIGIIIFLFPLDVQIAYAIVVITGITYTLYFISVFLPIRYPDCPYTSSLTTYIGSVFYFALAIMRLCFDHFKKSMHFQDLYQEVLYWKKSLHKRILHWEGLLRGYYITITRNSSSLSPSPTLKTPVITIQDTLSTAASRVARNLQVQVADYVNKVAEANVTSWRERNMNKVIQANSGLIELKALEWLHTISSNPSIRRIIAWGVSVHPDSVQVLSEPILKNIWTNLRINENYDFTDFQDLRHRLCMDLQYEPLGFTWFNFLFKENELTQLNEESQNYSLLAWNVFRSDYSEVLTTALGERVKLPLVMWHHILKKAPINPTLVALVLTSRRYPFGWKSTSNLVPDATYGTGDVSFDVEQLNKWVFDYLFQYFCHDASLDSLSENLVFEARYRLLVSIYRNLISNISIIRDEEQRIFGLERLFNDFYASLWKFPPQYVSPERPFTFCKDILCVAPDMGFQSLADHAFSNLAEIQGRLLLISGSSCFFIRCQYEDISLIYDRISQDIVEHPVIHRMYAIGSLFFMPQNRAHLLKKLSDDSHSTALSRLSKCLHVGFRYLTNFRFLEGSDYEQLLQVQREYIYPNLMYLFRAKYPKTGGHLVEILYDFSVLAEIWKHLVFTRGLDEKAFLHIIKLKLGPRKSVEFLVRMIQEAEGQEGRLARSDCHILLESANEFKYTLTVNFAPNSIFMPEVPAVSKSGRSLRGDDVEAGAHETNTIEVPY